MEMERGDRGEREVEGQSVCVIDRKRERFNLCYRQRIRGRRERERRTLSYKRRIRGVGRKYKREREREKQRERDREK